MKRDLLLTELQVRASANATSESILYQGRMALVTVLAGFVVLISGRARKAKNQTTEADFKPSRSLAWGLIILTVFLYWSDRFLTDLQQRTESRAIQIAQVLDSMPAMTQAEVETIRTYSSLQHDDPFAKLLLLFRCPTFAQIIGYFPLTFMLGILIWESYKRK
jgi:hypothetical protein